MEMNRRMFVGTLSTGAAAIALAGTSACNPTDVWHEIEAWVPLGITAFESILALVAPLAAPGIDAIATLVKAGFSTLAAAIDAYLNAPAADKATFAQKVQLAFQDLVNNIQAFLTAIGQSTSPIVTEAVALIQIIVETIEGFLGQIMPTPTPVATFHLGGKSMVVTPVRRNRASFISAFNEVCNANNIPAARLPQTR
jgi:hypothetical protein